jgi:hypothetical protein
MPLGWWSTAQKDKHLPCWPRDSSETQFQLLSEVVRVVLPLEGLCLPLCPCHTPALLLPVSHVHLHIGLHGDAVETWLRGPLSSHPDDVKGNQMPRG